MSRCKACDCKMTEQELCNKVFNKVTDKLEYTDLCNACSYSDDEYVDVWKFTKHVEEEDE